MPLAAVHNEAGLASSSYQQLDTDEGGEDQDDNSYKGNGEIKMIHARLARFNACCSARANILATRSATARST
jgi:hypothetical protein